MKEDKSERREDWNLGNYIYIYIYLIIGRQVRQRWILLGFCYEETNREG